MNPFAPETCHEWLLDTAPRALAFSPQNDFAGWRQAVETKLRELVGVLPDPVPLNLRAEPPIQHAAFREIRLTFAVERGAEAVAHLLLPTEGAGPFPVVICLQGHSTGMHISLGRAKYEGDERVLEGDRDYAIQAVRQGYAALALEQRCFGERKDARPKGVRHVDHGCHHATMVALLLGRAMIGERVWDVSRAIDALNAFPEVDTNRIGCMGNSGGGTITYFAASPCPPVSSALFATPSGA
jgi:cephalosporin-C deacetylase-like acetyl esterase